MWKYNGTHTHKITRPNNVWLDVLTKLQIDLQTCSYKNQVLLAQKSYKNLYEKKKNKK